jgi:integrase
MASIYKRGGVWYLSYYLDGRRIRKRVGKSKRIAELARQETEVKLAKNEIGGVEVKEVGFNEFKREYLGYLKTNNRPSTCLRYKKTFHHFENFLQKHLKDSPKLSPIPFHLIEDYKQQRVKFVKPLTVNVELKVLKAMYNYAIKCRCVRENPVKKVSFYRAVEKKPRSLTGEEITHLLANSDGLYPIIYTFLKTGLRKGELINLKWEDIDFKRKRMTVESKEEWRTKTGNSRQIPLSDDLLEVLRILPRCSEYVFVNSNGRKYGYHLTERVKRLAKRLGLEGVTLHTP